MILNFIKYLYSLLFSIFIFLLVSSYFFENISLNNNFIYLFSLLVIPVVDIIVEKVKMNIKLLILIALILFSYTYIFSITDNTEIIEASLIYSYIFLVTWAITQYVWFIIESKNKKLSITKIAKKPKKWLDDYFYMFYILIWILFLIWLLIEVIWFVFNDYSFVKLAWVFLVFTLLIISTQKIKLNIKKTLNNRLKNINSVNFLKFRKKINDNKLFKVMTELDIRNDIVFYIIFIFFTLIFVWWYIYNIENLLIMSYVFIFISYIAFKIYWFKIEPVIEKKDFNSDNFLITLISFSLIFALSISKILEWYLLNDYKNFNISIFILFYLFFFSLTFSDFKFNSLTKKHRTLQKITFNKLYEFHKQKVNYSKILWIASITLFIIAMILKYNYLFIDNSSEKYINNNTTEQEKKIIIDKNLTETDTTNESTVSNDKKVEENGIWTSEVSKNKIKIWELYKFRNYLWVWNESEDTMKLEEYIKKLWYFVWDVDWKFDTNTKIALRNVLMYECHWPTTAKWVLWTNAAECIEWLEINKE